MAETKVKTGELDNTAGEIAGAWLAWTPTYDGFTIGNGTFNGQYTQIGKTIIAKFKITFGSTTVITKSYPNIYLPVSGVGSIMTGQVIWSYLKAGVAGYSYCGTIASNSFATMIVGNASGTYLLDNSISSTIPFTWTTGDQLFGQLTYEAA